MTRWITIGFLFILDEMAHFEDLQGFKGKKREIGWHKWDELKPEQLAFKDYEILEAAVRVIDKVN